MLRHFNVPEFTEDMRRRIAASCWFESPHESAAMWRLYAPGKEGVAIATTFGKLDNLIKTAAKPAWLVGAARVKYIDHSNDGWIENLGEEERRLNVLTGIRQHAAKAHTGRDGTIDLRQSHFQFRP